HVSLFPGQVQPGFLLAQIDMTAAQTQLGMRASRWLRASGGRKKPRNARHCHPFAGAFFQNIFRGLDQPDGGELLELRGGKGAEFLLVAANVPVAHLGGASSPSEPLIRTMGSRGHLGATTHTTRKPPLLMR